MLVRAMRLPPSLATNLNMPLPCVLARRDGARHPVVSELGVFSEAPPETELLAGVVALVDEVGLVGVLVVVLDKSLDRTFPGFSLEGAAFAQAETVGLAERAEKGGLVLSCPTKSGAAMFARRVRGSVGPAGVGEGVVRHGGEGWLRPESGGHQRRQRWDEGRRWLLGFEGCQVCLSLVRRSDAGGRWSARGQKRRGPVTGRDWRSALPATFSLAPHSSSAAAAAAWAPGR
ncbi:hypothetical protein QBC47DRAFT_96145 [Echria macrotheca]|uniref:Uncharacterized protein n=1 Tax=Echria macrotheca TaxID=438768 RepID=A0AAJ0BKE2_9PEZI|nr:hypothetical protein QBC47DRAFT_96145 [Echria macrotheca]